MSQRTVLVQGDVSTRDPMLAAVVCGIFATISALSLLSYVFYGMLTSWCRRPQNLKTKYGASWAVVTGASSGIGLAIAQRLANQGLNIVLVAVPNKLLDEVTASFRKEYPALQFRSVGVDLSSASFMEPITAATADITPQIISSNAGYILTGFFTARKLSEQVANFNCNAACGVPIAHHFISKLQAAKLRGCVVFTSSPAGFMACPFSAMYGTSYSAAVLVNLTLYSIRIECQPLVTVARVEIPLRLRINQDY